MIKITQVRFTMPTGSGVHGRKRVARWKRAAKIVLGPRRGAMTEWIRNLCDEEAEKVLSNGTK